jgi:hypothetical protein
MKNKQAIIGGGVLLLVVLSGGFGLWQHSHSEKAAASLSLLQGDGYSLPTDQSQAGSTGSGTGPLASNGGTTSGGLNVSSGGASNQLGQIAPTGGSSAGSAAASASGGSSSSSPSPLDPSTFAQYEKYKDGQSGLFGDIQVGTGDELTDGKKAAVYYKGWLTNGTLFDQSRAGSDGKLQPFIFQLGAHQVIAGWEQALAGMKVGGTRLLIIPPAVGYGAAGQGSIPPNATLVFQVQLTAVQ